MSLAGTLRLFELPNRQRYSIFSETSNFLEVYGGQADAFAEGKIFIPNVVREGYEEMQSDLDWEETEGVTHLTFYLGKVQG
jgi:hypothetical protein